MKSLEELRAIRAKMQGRVGVRAENAPRFRDMVRVARVERAYRWEKG